MHTCDSRGDRFIKPVHGIFMPALQIFSVALILQHS